MNDNSTTNATNTGRFTGLAETYAKHRPTYPAEALAGIAGFCADGNAPKVLADVGAGTGISTRAMFLALGGSEAGWSAFLIEPNDDMRGQAAQAAQGIEGLSVVKGQSEDLPLGNGGAGLILAAQAAHWFDRPKFYAEAGRALATGGVLCILYNNRDLYGDPLMAAFESLVEETVPEYQRAYRSWDLMSELNALDWTSEVAEQLHPWVWRITPEAFTGLMLSRSKMRPFTDAIGTEKAQAAIMKMAHAHAAPDGLVDVKYVTQAGLVRAK